MKVQVKLFAVARQLANAPCVELEVPERATIAQVREALVDHVPELSEVARRVLFAVNADYAADATTVSPEDEIACIPPVSGG